MRISDWSSDVCSYDLAASLYGHHSRRTVGRRPRQRPADGNGAQEMGQARMEGAVPARDQARRDRLSGHPRAQQLARPVRAGVEGFRSEEHTSELQSLMRISYAVFCLKKKYMMHSRI